MIMVVAEPTTYTYTPTDIITILGVLFGGLAGIIAAVFAGLAALRSAQTKSAVHENVVALQANTAVTEKVHQAVKTMNDMSLGQLADATETRRIVEVHETQRTDAEREHLHDVPLHEHPKEGEV